MPFDEGANWALPCEPKESARKCLWSPNSTAASPHVKRSVAAKPKIYPDITYAIGGTPLVRLNRIPKEEGVGCEVLAKCEYLSAGGSVKDRIGLRMVLDAEETGRIAKGDTLIEPTSGNTGIGLALVSAARGYRCVIVMPEKMSKEKENTLKGLGAEVIRTPTAASYDSPESLVGVARRLLDEMPNSHILDQYRNPSNPMAHYDGTADEIIDGCDGKLDMVVISAGTGGTIAGIGRRIKERLPNCKVVGVDPVGSCLACDTDSTGFYEVEGIGYDFIPAVLDRKIVDKWYRSRDLDSFKMARRIMKEEGMLVGGSCGSALTCALLACKDAGLGPNQRCVVLFPDSVRNYMSKFLSDDWLVERHLIPVPEPSAGHKAWKKPLAELSLKAHPSIVESVPLVKAKDLLNTAPGKCLIVYNEDHSKVIGVLTLRRLMSEMLRCPKFAENIPVSAAVVKQFKPIPHTESLGIAAKFLEHEDFILIGPLPGDKNEFALMTPELLNEHLFALSVN